MNLEGVASYLQSQGLAVQGKTLFINEMPIEVTEGVLLRVPYSGTRIDHELPQYRATGFRAAVRSRDYQKGQDLAWSVTDALTLLYDLNMPGMQVKSMRPTHEPRPFRRSKGGFWEWELEFECNYVRV